MSQMREGPYAQVQRLGRGVLGVLLECVPDEDVGAVAAAGRVFYEHPAVWRRRVAMHWEGAVCALQWLRPREAWDIFHDEATGALQRARLLDATRAVPPTTSVLDAARHVTLHDAYVKYKALTIDTLDASQRWFAQCVVLSDIDISQKTNSVTCTFAVVSCAAPHAEVTVYMYDDLVDMNVHAPVPDGDEGETVCVFSSEEEDAVDHEALARLVPGARLPPQDVFRIVSRLAMFPKACVPSVRPSLGLGWAWPTQAQCEEVAAYLDGRNFRRARRVM